MGAVKGVRENVAYTVVDTLLYNQTETRPQKAFIIISICVHILTSQPSMKVEWHYAPTTS